MKSLITLLLIASSLIGSAQLKTSVEWSEELEKSRSLWEFVEHNNEVFSKSVEAKMIVGYDLSFKKTREIEVNPKTLFVNKNVKSLSMDILSSDGKLWILVGTSEKTKANCIYECVAIEVDLQKNQLSDNRVTIFHHATESKNERLYLHKPVVKNGRVEITLQDQQMPSENPRDVMPRGIKFACFDEKFQAIQSVRLDERAYGAFTENGTLISYVKKEDGKHVTIRKGDKSKTINFSEVLETDLKIEGIKSTINGQTVVTGFCGPDFSRGRINSTVITGVFRVVLDQDFNIVEDLTSIYTTPGGSNLEHVRVSTVEFNNIGDVFLLMVGVDSKTIDVVGLTRMNVIGLTSAGNWIKAIPFNQSRSLSKLALGEMRFVHENDLVLIFSDHKSNVSTFDYNNYQASEATRAERYVYPVPSSVTVLRIDIQGHVEKSSHDLTFGNITLRRPLLLNDGSVLLRGGTVSGGVMGNVRLGILKW
jgi:hypothetical protein